MIARRTRTIALLTAPAAILGLGLAAAGPAAASTAAVVHAVPQACVTANPIEINGFAFSPGQVTPGESAVADLITTNCAAVSVSTIQQWTGQWILPTGTGSSNSGCPVIDPLVRDVTYAPDQEIAENQTYLVPAGCKALELVVTVRISLSTGANAETASATLKIIQPA